MRNISWYIWKTQDWFKCNKCGYKSDTDKVEALSIATRVLNAFGA